MATNGHRVATTSDDIDPEIEGGNPPETIRKVAAVDREAAVPSRIAPDSKPTLETRTSSTAARHDTTTEVRSGATIDEDSRCVANAVSEGERVTSRADRPSSRVDRSAASRVARVDVNRADRADVNRVDRSAASRASKGESNTAARGGESSDTVRLRVSPSTGSVAGKNRVEGESSTPAAGSNSHCRAEAVAARIQVAVGDSLEAASDGTRMTNGRAGAWKTSGPAADSRADLAGEDSGADRRTLRDLRASTDSKETSVTACNSDGRAARSNSRTATRTVRDRASPRVVATSEVRASRTNDAARAGGRSPPSETIRVERVEPTTGTTTGEGKSTLAAETITTATGEPTDSRPRANRADDTVAVATMADRVAEPRVAGTAPVEWIPTSSNPIDRRAATAKTPSPAAASSTVSEASGQNRATGPATPATSRAVTATNDGVVAPTTT